MSSVYNSIMGDTVGVLWRAGTGTVDPWTKQQIVDDATQTNINAGMSSDEAQQQAESDVTNTLSTFTLGNGDKVGADPTQATLSLPSAQSFKDAFGSMFNDAGTGCGITNLAGCYPSWLPYVAIGAGALLVLWVLRPYVGLFEE